MFTFFFYNICFFERGVAGSATVCLEHQWSGDLRVSGVEKDFPFHGRVWNSKEGMASRVLCYPLMTHWLSTVGASHLSSLGSLLSPVGLQCECAPQSPGGPSKHRPWCSHPQSLWLGRSGYSLRMCISSESSGGAEAAGSDALWESLIGEYTKVLPVLGVDSLYRAVPSFSGPVSLSWQWTWKLACLWRPFTVL